MPKRILLADDSITIQKVVELTFSDGDYEVTAVNNGAKAIHKLGEMRPDIILSDIIMPEKNGYEVCEYVKSNPEYRNIPVVLLTGTFEPFDPDRAEKAGCDAVVTKPFESQSLIHKVEELIASAKSAAPAAAAAPAPSPEPIAVDAPSPWIDDEPAAPVQEIPPQTPSPFTTSSGRFPTATDDFTNSNDIFGAAPAPAATTEMPFDTTAETPFGGGETRAFPRMSFDDFPAPIPTPEPPPPPAPAEPSPWDEQDFGEETRAFGKVAIDDLQSMQQPLAPAAPQEQQPQAAEPDSPFGAPPPAEEFSSETRAFSRVSFEELQQQMAQPAPEPEPEPPAPAASAPSPWDEPAETPLFSSPAYDAPTPEPQAPRPEPQAETSPWDDQPAFGGETRAFPKMTFDDLAAMAPTPEPQSAEPEPEPQPAPWDEPSAPAWVSDAAAETPAEPQGFATAAYEPFATQTTESELPPVEQPMVEDLPFASSTTGEPELELAPAAEEPPAVEPQWSEPQWSEQQPSDALPIVPQPLEAPVVPPPADEPAWSTSPAAEAAAEPDEPVVPPAALAPQSPAISIRSSDLSDEQIDKIARRVVELMSDQVVRNIAWEVIPDLAEMVVKERIRQLESEA